jgi:signal transduction histidine kinase
MARLQRTLLAPVVLLFVGLVSALGYAAYEGFARARALRQRVDAVERASALILRLNALERETLVNVLRYAAEPDGSAGAELERTDPETTRVLAALRGVDSSPGGRRMLAQYVAARNARRSASGDLVAAAAARDTRRFEIASRRWDLARHRTEALLADVSAYNFNLLKGMLRELDRRRGTSLALLMIGFGLSFGVVLAYGWYVARRVVGPVSALTRAAAGLPHGPFVPPAEALARGDEIGVLAGTLARVTEEMRLSNERMREAVRARDEFLSVASHELRTPLTTLKLQLQSSAARARPDGGGDAPRWCDVSLRQVARLEKLVSELLDVTRLREGRMVLQLEETDLAALVHSVVERLAVELRQGGHDVALALRPALGSWDASRLEQVVTNLVMNVIRHAPAAPLRITVEPRGGRGVLTVADEGPGVGEEFQPRLFHYFEQGARARTVGGLGLGLFISRSIVEAHGGTLRLARSSGPGAEFVVELPLEPPTGAATGSPAQRPSP